MFECRRKGVGKILLSTKYKGAKCAKELSQRDDEKGLTLMQMVPHLLLKQWWSIGGSCSRAEGAP